MEFKGFHKMPSQVLQQVFKNVSPREPQEITGSYPQRRKPKVACLTTLPLGICRWVVLNTCTSPCPQICLRCRCGHDQGCRRPHSKWYRLQCSSACRIGETSSPTFCQRVIGLRIYILFYSTCIELHVHVHVLVCT